MLWEVMIEMLGELFLVLGEILKTLLAILVGTFKYFKKKNTEKQKAVASGDPAVAQAAVQAQKTQAQLILIFTILGLGFTLAMMIPSLRHAVFGSHGIGGIGGTIVEAPRNELPMGQYTVPQLFQKKKYVVDDGIAKRTFYYYWYAPPVAAGQKLPLVVVLHGKDGMSQAAMHLRTGAVQKQFPSYLLIPLSPKGMVWDAPAKYSGEEFPKASVTPVPGAAAKSLLDVIILLADLTQRAAIDENRMYVIGCDEGAGGVYGAAANYPGVFAAGVALAGQWSFLDRLKLAKTPLLILHGTDDKVVPAQFASNMTQVINAAHGQAAYHEFPGLGHDCDSGNFYSQVVWDWMFSQQRPAPVSAEIPAH